MGRLRSIQILRALAVTLVVLCHCTQVMAGLVGVDIFFVISGFIICRVSEGRPAGDFLRDRAVRVLPLWWIMAIPWVGIAIKLHLLTPQMLGATVTLWPIYDVVASPAHAPGWSLQFEELFYLATGLGLALPRLRRLLPVMWGIFLVAGLLSGSPLIRFLGHPIMLEFFAGVLIAKSAYQNRGLGAVAVVLALAAFGWFTFQKSRAMLDLSDQIGFISADDAWRWAAGGLPGPAWRWLLWGLPAAALVWGTLQFEEAFAASWWRPVVLVGDASYSIYLTHLLAKLFLGFLLPGWAQIVPCILIGVGVWRYLETPLLAGLRKLRTAPALAPAT